jgi:glycosyltransferase involved in cell wall biosynthesis
MPLVSVLMTVYDREKFLRTAIESVLVQSLEDFELIIVDDCSTDRSVEIARSYEFDRRVKVYINDNTLGDYPNRNRAAALARGKYLKYLDADDMMYPHALQVFVTDMEAFPNALFALTASPYYSWITPIWLNPHESYLIHYMGRGLLARSPCGAIIRRNAFQEFGPFSSERYVSDTKLWFVLARKSGVLLTNQGLSFWRSHGITQESHRQRGLRETFQLWHTEREALDHPECPLNTSERHLAHKLHRSILAREVIARSKRFELTAAKTLMKEGNIRCSDLLLSRTRYHMRMGFVGGKWLERLQSTPKWRKMAFAKMTDWDPIQ